MRIHVLVLSAVLLLVCSGCSSPDQYYRLSASGEAPLRTAGLAVGVGPVTLPSYIDRAELVFQSGDNQFQVPTKAHWTGSLGENITRVLAADLGRRLGSGNVVAAPWPPTLRLRYQTPVEVQQFHAISGSDAILQASWRVEDASTHTVLRRRNAMLRERVEGDGYNAVVAAESRLLDKLAGEITASLR